jgi:hypothetical protein
LTAAPQPLDEHVVPPGALAVYADGDAVVGEHSGEPAPVNCEPWSALKNLRRAVAPSIGRIDSNCRRVRCTMTERAEQSNIMAGGIIAGKVIDPRGKPIAGASVMIVQGPQHEDIALLTDEKGEFILGTRASGKYRLLVNAPGFPPAERDVEVKGGETTATQIKVRGS